MRVIAAEKGNVESFDKKGRKTRLVELPDGTIGIQEWRGSWYDVLNYVGIEYCAYGHAYMTGEWPFCKGIKHAQDHGVPGVSGRDPFEPYFDAHISERGEFITSRGHRDAICRERKLERG